MQLSGLEIGQTATVSTVGGEQSLRRHFLDMGLIPGASVRLMGYAPMGDPMELQVQGYALTMLKADASLIEVTLQDRPVPDQSHSVPVDDGDFGYITSLHEHNAHPGLGEEGRYHLTGAKPHELPKGTLLTFALAGQQNCGKTTLFNRLTGSNQHVGNFPGVTVDRKDGSMKLVPDTVVTDLPGIYSLSTYTTEELVSRDFLINEKPRGIINVVDAGNIERNLYLTVQLMEMDIPMVLAVNMMDELRGNGGSIRINEMERILGIPVIPVSAIKDEGTVELIQHAVHIAKYQEKPLRQDFCDKNDYGGAVHRCMHGIMHLIEDHAIEAGIPLRFAASRLIEGDTQIEQRLGLTQNEKEMMEHIVVQMEQERGLDRAAAMADMRFSFIRRLCSQTVVKPRESREYLRSRRIDKVLTGHWSAIPIFIAIICLVIWLSVDLLGAPLQNMLQNGIDRLAGITGAAMEKAAVSPAIISLVIDGIFGGVGSVISFVPVIILMFFFLSIIEDSGYMARIAFVTDKLLRKLGLSGRSIVPLLIGFGCSVPAVMASRTLPSARDRLKTIMLTPFISCSAKIPVYAFLTSAFFPRHSGLVLIALYLVSVLLGILVALVSKYVYHSVASPFVMELPNYRLPSLKNTGHLLWDKTKDFCQKAITVIFIATIIIWLLQSFNFKFQMVENGQGSMLAWIANLIAPVFGPIGLDDWRIVTALISGFLAKESVVSTLQVLGATQLFTTLTAVSMLLFCLLYTPCIASISAVKRELGGKWAAIMVVFQCAVAWIAAFVGYSIVSLLLQ